MQGSKGVFILSAITLGSQYHLFWKPPTNEVNIEEKPRKINRIINNISISIRKIWKPVTNENDDENAEKDPQEVAENVHEHDRRQSHLEEIDICFNDFFYISILH